MEYTLLEPPDAASCITQSVDLLSRAIASSINRRGHCLLGLSGGKTPKELYKALGEALNVEWGRVHLFLIDERCVPPDHEESNIRLLKTTILRGRAHEFSERCTFPDTSLPPQQCADQYDQALRALFKEKGPADLLLIGIGTDGHVASLFPPVPQEAFGERCAIHTTTPSTGSGQADVFAIHDRISMTIPPLHQAHQQIFFFTGEEKRRTWDAMMESPEGPERWPMKGIMAYGETTVIAGK